MKKAFIILVTSVLCLFICCAHADPVHFRVTLRSDSLSGEPSSFSADVYHEYGMLWLFSDTLGDLCLRRSFPYSSLLTAPISPEDLFPDSLNRQMAILFSTVRAAYGSSVRNGVYAGDAFNFALEAETVRFSGTEIQRIAALFAAETAGPGSGFIPVLLTLFRSAEGTEFELTSFDNGSYYSLNGVRNGEVVCTCSINLSDPDHGIVIAGYGSGKKNYYEAWNIERMQEGCAVVRTTLYADDRQTGYPGLTEGDTVISLQLAVEPANADGSYAFSVAVFPSNISQGMTLRGTRFSAAEGRILEAEFGFDGEAEQLLLVTVDADSQASSRTDFQVADASGMNTEEKSRLGLLILTRIRPFLIRLMVLMPSEYYLFMLNQIF